MDQCAKQLKFSTLCKKSLKERREEVCCSFCRDVFCCIKDREKHEEVEHGDKDADVARQQRKMLKENKPLVCLLCCQVFLSGLFVNNSCKSVSGRATSKFKVLGPTHVLIIIPDWAVEKYFVPHQRKRSWDKANECHAEVNIMVHEPDEKPRADSAPVQENSFGRKTAIQSILSKQRKTDVSERRGRRVTFSPITAVMFTSRQNTIEVVAQQAVGDSTNLTPNLPVEEATTDKLHPRQLLLTETEIHQKPDDRSNSVSFSMPKSEDKAGDVVPTFSPGLPNSCHEENNVEFVFSPPLPNGGTDGSPMMLPQMSSTPVNGNPERRNVPVVESPSEHEETQEDPPPAESIFSTLANVICCAFQSLPAALIQFFSANTENDQSYHQGNDRSLSRRQRRQRRRTALFTPYASVSNKRRDRRHTQRTGAVNPSILALMNQNST